jgi:endonuclease/exonuclease/phosphatase family metal-dependent hydrolase
MALTSFDVLMRTLGRGLAAGALVTLASIGVVRSAAAQVRLDVMTFNIRTSYAEDGDNGWPHRKALVVDTIRRFTPQVLGMQEALNDQVEYLAAALPEYRWLGVDRALNGGQVLSEYTPIFYRHDELIPIESGNFWLSAAPDPLNRPTGDGRGFRIVTWARFHHLASGRQVYVFNTHFTLRPGQVQLDSAEIVKARVAALPAGSAVIVMGDFNAIAEGSDVWLELTSHGLHDAWVVAHERRGPALTLSGFGPPRDGETGRIDWILVGGPIDVSSTETVLHNDKGRYPSDHYPVAARLIVR